MLGHKLWRLFFIISIVFGQTNFGKFKFKNPFKKKEKSQYYQPSTYRKQTQTLASKMKHLFNKPKDPFYNNHYEMSLSSSDRFDWNIFGSNISHCLDNNLNNKSASKYLKLKY